MSIGDHDDRVAISPWIKGAGEAFAAAKAEHRAEMLILVVALEKAIQRIAVLEDVIEEFRAASGADERVLSRLGALEARMKELVSALRHTR